VGDKLAENIKNILGDRPLDYIFLTHSHYDHVLGSVYVKKHYTQAKIVAGEYAAKIYEKPTAKALMRELDQIYVLAQGISEYEDLIDNLSVDISVKDNDILVAGDMTFEVIYPLARLSTHLMPAALKYTEALARELIRKIESYKA
jgi:glyoxylase-like metal-dependent hydrolase (beta-lactamase superfamily II)